VVVEKNRQVLEREQQHEVPLHEGDRLEIVQFVGGG
jgi:thiamine biosynthesis protein ThiS